MTNVIRFPHKGATITVGESLVQEKIAAVRLLDNISLDIVTDVLKTLKGIYGLDITVLSKTQMRDIGMLAEAVKSILYGYYDHPYPIHALADALFKLSDTGELSVRPFNIQKEPNAAN